MEILGLVDIPAWLLLTMLMLLLAYIYFTWNFDTFKNMGIPGPKPYPVVGTALSMFFGYSDIRIFDREMVKKYGKFVGLFEGRNPVLLVADPEAMKQIMVKDFNTFTNRPDIINPDILDPPANLMLTTIKDEHWAHIRKLLSPSFTTGRLKKMIGHLNKNADDLVEALEEKAKGNEDVDIKLFMGCFTMDAIASSAFGLDLNSQKDPKNPFVEQAKKMLLRKPWIFVLLFIMPKMLTILKKVFNIQVFPKSSMEFFADVVKKAMKQRREQNMEQSDFLQLMMEAHTTLPTQEEMEDKEIMGHIMEDSRGLKWTDKGLTEDEILAQAVLFFFAGYETTAQTLQYLAYELALNPDKQEKLIEEVDRVTEGKPVTHEMASNLHYLEQATNETLRLHNVAFRTNRVAKETVTVSGITIPKGMRVDFPLEAIHYDPEAYPEPEKFIPERFSPEERAGRNQYQWIPFGAGPRNCIGMRLALLEVKIAMARILQKLKFVKCDKTEVPIIMQVGQPKNPVTLGLKSR